MPDALAIRGPRISAVNRPLEMLGEDDGLQPELQLCPVGSETRVSEPLKAHCADPIEHGLKDGNGLLRLILAGRQVIENVQVYQASS